MRLSRVKRSPALGINLTPMIDIVFLLIIFFMTVSQISRSVKHPVNLPEVGPGGVSPEMVDITINLDARGQMVVLGRFRTPQQLDRAMVRELGRVANDPARLRILIRCDRECPGKPVNDLVHQLEVLGIRQVRIAILASR